MNDLCKACDLNQLNRICSILSLDEETKAVLRRKVEAYLTAVDMRKSNPEAMGEIWKIISAALHNDDPYREIKAYYNQEVQRLIPEIERLIQSSGDRRNTALKLSVCGNLIDFAAKHKFHMETLNEKIRRLSSIKLAVDDSREMFHNLESAKTLLYLGDNCGEIVLDKMLIQEIKKENPELRVFYGVRGRPIVNDITRNDAKMVRMDESATVISNGDGALGTVLKNASSQFRKIYEQADIVICKGQGNYEGLSDSIKDQLYFLFMAKCEVVSNPLHIPLMSIVCMKNASASKKQRATAE